MGNQESTRLSISVKNANDAINNFGLGLCSVVPENSVHSPLSAGIVIALLHNGAEENTEKELTCVFGKKITFDELTEMYKVFNNDVMTLSNVLVVNKDMCVRKDYLEKTKALALVCNEDFSDPSRIVDMVNKFIADGTKNLIKDVLKPEHVEPSSPIILVNTIYFKAPWKKEFSKHMTRKAKFNDSIDIQMMCKTKSFPYFEDKNVQIVELPYKGDQFFMGIILPKNHRNLKGTYQYLMNKPIEKSERVEVNIPKFTQRKNLDMIPLMRKNGINDLFSETNARLGGMMESKTGTYVSTVIHEAVVIVDERGTEAAAVTVAVCMNESCVVKPDPIIFNADHDFVYYIKHRETNTLLFVGDFHGQSS